jgi:integrase
MARRKKTKYPGVFYRKAKRIGAKGIEKVYYVVYKKNGKVYEEKAGRQYADDMTPARAVHIRSELIENKRPTRKEKRRQEHAKKEAEAGKWTLDRLWKEYKKNRPLKGIATYKSQYDLYLKPSFGKKEPKDIIQLDVDRLRIKILKKRKPQTVKHVLSLLGRIIKFGVRKQLCQGLNFIIEKPIVHNVKTEDLSNAQLVKLLKAIDADEHPQAGPMMKFALFTGLRRGEMFKLKWRHIDFERGFLTLRDPKGGPDQIIPLNNSAKELLKNHPREKSPFVFPGRKGGQRVNIGKQVRKIADDAKLPKNFRPLHGLRHTYASMLASSGQVDLYVLQKLLTHKNPQTTQRYAHLRDKALKKASDLAGDIINETLKEKSKKVVNLEAQKQ